MLEREQMSSTYLGKGIAMPHRSSQMKAHPA
ncbi:PTS sugar transporter subunit IIA [Bacillus sp. SL00103]